MKLAPKLSICLIALSLAVFYSAFYHYQSLLGEEYKLAEKVAALTSVVSSKEAYSEPVMVGGHGNSIVEETGVIYLFGLACILSLLAFAVVVVERIKYGAYQLFVPIAFCSVTVVGCVLITGYKYALDFYA